MTQENSKEALQLLDEHYETFHRAAKFAERTGHPVPSDTRGWSQILVSTLTGLSGLARKKGADLKDGSDVKGANTWSAIDRPRFNGVIKSGTKAEHSDQMKSLDLMPHVYLVLWDISNRQTFRCRVWVANPQKDKVFRAMCAKWYANKAAAGSSANFQLHPPRGNDLNVITNSHGNLVYPLLFAAERTAKSRYKLLTYDATARVSGRCVVAG